MSVLTDVRRVTQAPRRLPTAAISAALAQILQAVGSFVLQIAAARALGAAGLGVISICLGTTILTTAVTSGMVGDSLTVLDRHDRRVRAGLQVWLVLLVVAGSVGAGAALLFTGLLTLPQAAIFALATAVFQLEEVLRRVLMAIRRFSTLLIVDGVAVSVTLGSLFLWADLDIAAFLLSVAIGQSAGVVCALVVTPAGERYLVPMRRAAVREVLGFGGWRGAQVALTPVGLTATRTIVLAGAGAVVLGEVEAARVFGAPALLVVQGLGSYLLSTYARDKALPLAPVRRRAARASLLMAGVAIGLGAALTLVTPWLAPLVVGRAVDVHVVTVLGWAVFAAATATMQPFTSLAVTRGHQRAVLQIRSLDVAVGVGLLLAATGWLGLPGSLTPYVLAVGPLLSGVLVRHFLLRPAVPQPLERS